MFLTLLQATHNKQKINKVHHIQIKAKQCVPRGKQNKSKKYSKKAKDQLEEVPATYATEMGGIPIRKELLTIDEKEVKNLTEKWQKVKTDGSLKNKWKFLLKMQKMHSLAHNKKNQNL